VLQWLRSQEPPCPWGPCALGAARANGRAHVVEWIQEHGEGMEAADPAWEGMPLCPPATYLGPVDSDDDDDWEWWR
jgi:hypothetical protein